jgi:TfoX/Sxy family transcriptional regulator of competence genes
VQFLLLYQRVEQYLRQALEKPQQAWLELQKQGLLVLVLQEQALPEQVLALQEQGQQVLRQAQRLFQD